MCVCRAALIVKETDEANQLEGCLWNGTQTEVQAQDQGPYAPAERPSAIYSVGFQHQLLRAIGPYHLISRKLCLPFQSVALGLNWEGKQLSAAYFPYVRPFLFRILMVAVAQVRVTTF